MGFWTKFGPPIFEMPGENVDHVRPPNVFYTHNIVFVVHTKLFVMRMVVWVVCRVYVAGKYPIQLDMVG